MCVMCNNVICVIILIMCNNVLILIILIIILLINMYVCM